MTGSARLATTTLVTPRPCVSLRRHGQLDVTVARLIQVGTIDATLAAFLSLPREAGATSSSPAGSTSATRLCS
jgi:Flp pilus assembly CpaF family ATPase